MWHTRWFMQTWLPWTAHNGKNKKKKKKNNPHPIKKTTTKKKKHNFETSPQSLLKQFKWNLQGYFLDNSISLLIVEKYGRQLTGLFALYDNSVNFKNLLRIYSSEFNLNFIGISFRWLDQIPSSHYWSVEKHDRQWMGQSCLIWWL